MNKHFLEILEKSRAIHDKKAADYTTNPTADPHENFTRASEIASWFPKEYGSYSALIGTKLSRLAALLSSGRIPNNESLDDTFLDLLTYVGLMYSFYKDSQIYQVPEAIFADPNPSTWTGFAAMPKATIGEPEYIRGLGADLPGKNKCFHNFVNKVTRTCNSCHTSISESTLLGKYLNSDRNEDTLVRKV